MSNRKIVSGLQSLLDRMMNDARTGLMFEADGDSLREAIAALRAADRARSTPKQGEAADWESRAELAEQEVVSLSEERDFMREKLSQEQAGAREIRRMLCASYAGSAAYMDDGEAQDNRERPCIDFLRMSPPAIMAAMQARALKAAAPPTSVEPAPAPHFTEAGVPYPIPMDWLRSVFERANQDLSYGFKQSRAGNYKNPAISRDWKWFRAGVGAAQNYASPPPQQVEPGWVIEYEASQDGCVQYTSPSEIMARAHAEAEGAWAFEIFEVKRRKLAAPKEPKP